MPGMAAYLPLGHRPAGLARRARLAGCSLDQAGRAVEAASLKTRASSKSAHDMKGIAHLLRRYGIGARSL